MAESQTRLTFKRQQQAELYGAPVAELTDQMSHQLGLDLSGVAGIIGVSVPMFSEVRGGRRVRIGNPAAAARFGMLRDFAADAARRSAGAIAPI